MTGLQLRMAEGVDEWVGLDEGRCVPMEVYVQVNFKGISTQTYTLSVVGIKGYLCSSIKKYRSSIILACLRCLSPH